MKITSATIAWSSDSNILMTEPVRVAVMNRSRSHHTLACNREGRGFEVAALQRFGPAELLEVLRPLVLHDLHDVVDRDDTDEASLIVHDRKAEKPVATHDPGHLFLIHGVAHGHHIVVHDVHDPSTRFGHDQFAEADDAA
ncbi:MAG: hypothetical protein P8Z74_00285, partial [Acidobacteriota bacterium]